jgi:hypothetical protein
MKTRRLAHSVTERAGRGAAEEIEAAEVKTGGLGRPREDADTSGGSAVCS